MTREPESSRELIEEIPRQITEKLEKLAKLPENWDSYGAPSISPSAVAKVHALLRRAFSRYGDRLPIPSIAPGSHGGLGIEWLSNNGNELILDIPPEETPTYLLVLVSPEGIEEENEGALESLSMLDELLAPFISSAVFAHGTAIQYRNKSRVERLLGDGGKALLARVTTLIRAVAAEREWPLQGIDVEHERDPEQSDWEYVVVSPVFNCPFEEADTMLHELYSHFDALAETLPKSDLAILEETIHFDVKQLTGVSST